MSELQSLSVRQILKGFAANGGVTNVAVTGSVNNTDSVRFTASVGITNVAVIGSVNNTDSDRFTPNVGVTKSVSDTDSDRFAVAPVDIESVKPMVSEIRISFAVVVVAVSVRDSVSGGRSTIFDATTETPVVLDSSIICTPLSVSAVTMAYVLEPIVNVLISLAPSSSSEGLSVR